MNMCLLEVAICEKCRSSHFQSEGEKGLMTGGLKNFRSGGDNQFFLGGGCKGNFAGWISTPLHAVISYSHPTVDIKYIFSHKTLYWQWKLAIYPVSICLLKVGNLDIVIGCGISSQLTVKATEPSQIALFLCLCWLGVY